MRCTTEISEKSSKSATATTCIRKTASRADFDGVLAEYSGEQIYNINGAYATSIHKAQGSEYAIVIMPIVKQISLMSVARSV